MVSTSDIVELARTIAGPDYQCGDDEDMFGPGRLSGAAARKFMDEFAKTHAVNMGSFLEFFHDIADESAKTHRVQPVGLDGKVLAPIPVTPRLLADAANQQTWPLEYPTHTLRSSRWPLILMFLLLALFVLAITVLGTDG